MTGRLGNNLLVHFPGDASLIGQLAGRLCGSVQGFYYMGRTLVYKETEWEFR